MKKDYNYTFENFYQSIEIYIFCIFDYIILDDHIYYLLFSLLFFKILFFNPILFRNIIAMN